MSAVERVSASLRRIADAAGHPAVWITVRSGPEALAEAAEIDRRVAAGEFLPLAGLVAAVKDNIDVAGLPTTAGARSYEYWPEDDAVAVARLRAAGAVVIGKTNLDQFATGLAGTRSPFGPVPNAWDRSRISGGSSSGSAVAVALGQVDVALGTDTAGSGRVPAALNGIIGVKPTRGLVPTTGVVPACRSLDCVTVLARRLDLARLVAELLADSMITRTEVHDHDEGGVAVPTAEHLRGLAPGWAERFAEVVEGLRRGGERVVEVDITPLLEASSLLEEGSLGAERTAAVGDHLAKHADLIGTDLDPTVAAIINGGLGISAVRVFRDQERLAGLKARGQELLAGTAALLTPTTTGHPTLAEVAADPIGASRRLGRFTGFTNLLDLASLAVPAGAVNGLPFGVMFTGPAFSDRRLARLAARVGADDIDLLVVGAHLSGQPLNGDLVRAGGTLAGPVRTAPTYSLHVLPTTPPKPGLVRELPGTGGGASIMGEVWRLPAWGFGAFVAALPQPMVIGRVDLDDGRQVSGFLCEPAALAGATRITAYGGWIAYLRAVGGHPDSL